MIIMMININIVILKFVKIRSIYNNYIVKLSWNNNTNKFIITDLLFLPKFRRACVYQLENNNYNNVRNYIKLFVIY